MKNKTTLEKIIPLISFIISSTLCLIFLFSYGFINFLKKPFFESWTKNNFNYALNFEQNIIDFFIDWKHILLRLWDKLLNSCSWILSHSYFFIYWFMLIIVPIILISYFVTNSKIKKNIPNVKYTKTMKIVDKLSLLNKKIKVFVTSDAFKYAFQSTLIPIIILVSIRFITLYFGFIFKYTDKTEYALVFPLVFTCKFFVESKILFFIASFYSLKLYVLIIDKIKRTEIKKTSYEIAEGLNDSVGIAGRRGSGKTLWVSFLAKVKSIIFKNEIINNMIDIESKYAGKSNVEFKVDDAIIEKEKERQSQETFEKMLITLLNLEAKMKNLKFKNDTIREKINYIEPFMKDNFFNSQMQQIVVLEKERQELVKIIQKQHEMKKDFKMKNCTTTPDLKEKGSACEASLANAAYNDLDKKMTEREKILCQQIAEKIGILKNQFNLNTVNFDYNTLIIFYTNEFEILYLKKEYLDLKEKFIQNYSSGKKYFDNDDSELKSDARKWFASKRKISDTLIYSNFPYYDLTSNCFSKILKKQDLTLKVWEDENGKELRHILTPYVIRLFDEYELLAPKGDEAKEFGDTLKASSHPTERKQFEVYVVQKLKSLEKCYRDKLDDEFDLPNKVQKKYTPLYDILFIKPLLRKKKIYLNLIQKIDFNNEMKTKNRKENFFKNFIRWRYKTLTEKNKKAEIKHAYFSYKDINLIIDTVDSTNIGAVMKKFNFLVSEIYTKDLEPIFNSTNLSEVYRKIEETDETNIRYTSIKTDLKIISDSKNFYNELYNSADEKNK